MSRRRRIWWRVGFIVPLVVLVGLVEARTSWFQSRLFTFWASGLGYRVQAGPEPDPWDASRGPYDQRLGYAKLAEMTGALAEHGFRIDSQARISWRLRKSIEHGLYPVYPEKTQAGLRITDRRGAELWSARYPARAYVSFADIPESVVRTLLFIENRELLTGEAPYRNPAVEWDRLAGAVVRLAARELGGPEGNVAGASTLATQIEKFRHSPGGRTSGAAQKLRQMATASMRAYSRGRDTREARESIVLDYVNSVPLAAIRDYGEVLGLKDGLERWFGFDAERADGLLEAADAFGAPPLELALADPLGNDEPEEAGEGTPGEVGGATPDEVEGATSADVEGAVPTEAVATGSAGPNASPGGFIEDPGADPGVPVDSIGLAYRATLGLMLAQRRPSFYLADARGRAELTRLIDVYLILLREAGVISAKLDSLARSVAIEASPVPPPPTAVPYVERKAANAVRTRLVGVLDVESLYDLDRLDVTARSTIDRRAQDTVTKVLRRLGDPGFVRSAGLAAPRMLATGDPSRVVYSFTLYELVERASTIRVQTDNFQGPFDLNQSSRLELGSTAKLRTLVTYLEVVERLYRKLSPLDAAGRRAVADSFPDALTRWAVAALERAPAMSLHDMLEAGMQHTYSGSPAERFFTGGGTHVFQNFDATYNASILTVRDGFRQSVNLVFVRIMRDIERFYRARLTSAAPALLDLNSPERRLYLERFADREGQQFVNRFFSKYQGKSADEILRTLVSGRRMTPQRLAWAYRTVLPGADAAAFEQFVNEQSPDTRFTPRAVPDVYRRANVENLSLADLGYLAGIHPLELWVVRFLIEQPGGTRAQAIEASAQARQDVYQWLFSPRRRAAQDRSISILLEIEAFLDVQRAWQRLGYPFDNLVPSYGTSIGSSGDRPGALAELIGILINDGIRLPTVQIESVEIGVGTPYETHLSFVPPEGVRVLSREVAATARQALLDVVNGGTGQFVRGAILDAAGEPVPVGGKTGTGNNQFKVFGAGGRLLQARTINRTATFAFFIGDRHFGVVTAHVAGPEAGNYQFTSSLPLRVFRLAAQGLQPLLEGSVGAD